jgi:hypothetical protein
MNPKPSHGAPEVVSEPREMEPQEIGRLPDLLERIAERAPTEEARLALSSGRVVEARSEGGGEDRVTIRSASGMVELEVRMTERGPVLAFRSADLELSATREVKVSCDTFHVRADKEIIEETGGDLHQTVNGNADVKVRGRLTTAAREARLAAVRGGVQIEANDDVQLVGERIKLNC